MSAIVLDKQVLSHTDGGNVEWYSFPKILFSNIQKDLKYIYF